MSDSTLSNKTYDRLKHLTQVVLPSLGSLYFGLSTIWGLPYGEQVVGSIVLTTTFLGISLGISNKNYNAGDNGVAGQMVIEERPGGGRLVQMELDREPADLLDQQKVVLEVVDKTKEDFWDPSSQD